MRWLLLRDYPRCAMDDFWIWFIVVMVSVPVLLALSILVEAITCD
jgi:hypothetical protein